MGSELARAHAAVAGRARSSFLRSTASVRVLLLLMVVIWGVNLTMIKVSMKQMLPLAFTSIRFALASVCLVSVQIARREPVWVARRDTWRVVLLALVGYTFYQMAFSRGIARTTADSASLILASVPILVALIGAALKVERLRWRGWVGVLACFAGILTVILGNTTGLSHGDLVGDLLVFVGAAAWAASTVMARPLLQRYSPMVLTTASMVAGTLGLLPASIPDLIRQDWSAVSPEAWLGLVYSAVLASSLANVIWNAGVGRVGGTGTAVYANVTPLFAVASAWFLLGERITWMQAAGALVIFVGLRLTQTDRSDPLSLAQGRGGE